MEEQEIKSIFLDMSNNSIPANAHNKVVAGEIAKSVYAVYSVQSINLILKEIKERYNLKAKHFNTQCLRRTFVCE